LSSSSIVTRRSENLQTVTSPLFQNKPKLNAVITFHYVT
jgi:hypothetical protein